MASQGPLPLWNRLMHFGLILFGIGAYLSGEGAESAETAGQSAYLLHAYLGLTLLAILLGRIGYGLAGPPVAGFGHWNPFTRAQLRAIGEDLSSLLRLRLPQRESHDGLAGLVQGLGFALFLWMSASGALIYFVGGSRDSGLMHTLGEWHHESGELLIPVFLALHVGAVVVHELSGHRVWRKISPFTRTERQPPEES